MKYDKIFVNLFMEADTGELPSEAELKKSPVGSPSPTTVFAFRAARWLSRTLPAILSTAPTIRNR